LRGDLGHERGAHAGQRDDPRHAGPQGTRRQDRRHRHLPQRHRPPSRSRPRAAPGHRRRARLRGHARLFRDGYADRDYLERYTDCPRELEEHLQNRGPDWASRITGLEVAEIEAFAKLVGTTKKTFFRLGYGFARQRNGAVNMHAASCIAAVTGAWQYEGGGAFHNNGAIFHWRKRLIEGLDAGTRPCGCSTSPKSAAC
jgi:hypothetical protein